MEDMMKKTLFLLLLILLVAMLVLGCSKDYFWLTDLYFEGLEECGIKSSVDIDKHIPFEMIEKFQHIDGDYYFYCRTPIYDKVLLSLSYDEQEYQNAKLYVVSRYSSKLTIDFSDSFESYNSYVFYAVRNEYPTLYTLVGFSDTYNTIVFLGLYASKYDYIDPPESFQQHIFEHFGEWYEFK